MKRYFGIRVIYVDELFKKLIAIDTSNDYPFHMPGHKRFGINGALESAYKMDITEIPGMDDLADAQGVILQEETFAQDRKSVV